MTTISFAPRLDRDVEVRGRDDPAVDQLAVLQPVRLVDHRQRRRGAHGRGDRHVVPAGAAEHDPLARVEVGGGQVQLARRARGSRRCGRGPRAPRGRTPRSPRRCTGPEGSRSASAIARSTGDSDGSAPPDLAHHAEQVQRQPHALGDELAVVRPQQHVQRHVAERLRHLVVDHPHHLLGRHAVGGQRRDQRAGAGADVDVELVDGAVDGQQIERAQRADLVHAAGEAAAAEHERGLGGPAAGYGAVARILRALRRCPSLLTQCTVPTGRTPLLPPPTRVSNRRWPGSPASRRCSPPCSRPPPRPAGPAATVRGARPADEPRRSRLRRLRGRPRQRRDAVRRAADVRAHPGVGEQALHDVGGAAALRRRRASSPPRCSATPSPTTTACVTGNLYLRGGGDPEFGRAEARGLARVLASSGLTQVTGRVIGRRVALRPPARRPGLQLRRLELGRPAERAVVQPRLHARPAARASSATPPATPPTSSGASCGARA